MEKCKSLMHLGDTVTVFSAWKLTAHPHHSQVDDLNQRLCKLELGELKMINAHR